MSQVCVYDSSSALANLIAIRKLCDSLHRPGDRSDYAVLLVVVGRYSEALTIFLDLDKQKPGQLNCAANIATTYERMGKNDLALQWINKAMLLDPPLRGSSDWIHKKIIEAKIAAKGDSTYYFTHDILGLGFGDAAKPVVANHIDLKLLILDLRYQLSERRSFFKVFNDPIITRLYFDLATAEALYKHMGNARHLFRFAGRNNFPADRITARLNYFEQLYAEKPPATHPQKSKPINRRFIPAIISGLLAVLVIFLFIRQRRRLNQSSD